MKTFMKKITVVTLTGVMAASLLSGCGEKKLDGSKTVATVNGTEIPMGLLSLTARMQQAQTEQIYRYFGITGSNIWSNTSEGSDRTYGEETVDSALDNLELLYLLSQKAEEYGVTVTDEEKAAIKEAAAAFMEANTEETLAELAVTQEQVEKYLELETIEHKIHDPIVADADTTVDEEEAQQSSFTYIHVDKPEEETEGTAEETEAAEGETEEATAEDETAASEAETAEVVTEIVVEETEAAAEGETEAAAEAETAAEGETEAATEEETEAAAETETVAEGETEAAAETETVAEGETEAAAETETAAEGETEAAAETETAAEAETAAEGETETAVEAETAAEGETETAVEAETAAEGETEAAAEEEEKDPRELIQEVLDRMLADPAADMDAVGEEIDSSLHGHTGSFTTRETDNELLKDSFDDAVIEALRTLSEGEVYNGVIETEDAYYVVRLDKEKDEEATQDKIDEMITSLEEEFYEETTTAWMDEAEIKVEDKVRDTLKITDSHTFTIIEDAEEETEAETEAVSEAETEAVSEAGTENTSEADAVTETEAAVETETAAGTETVAEESTEQVETTTEIVTE